MPDSQTLGLFIAATLAGIVCFRLYMVLGRRTGHEPPPQARPSPLSAPTPVAQPVPAALEAPTPTAKGGLLEIQLADRSFDAARFLGGAQQAYTMIVDAFARGDRDALKPLLSPLTVRSPGAASRPRRSQNCPTPRSSTPCWTAGRRKSPSPSRRNSMPVRSPMSGPSRAMSMPATPTGC